MKFARLFEDYRTKLLGSSATPLYQAACGLHLVCNMLVELLKKLKAIESEFLDADVLRAFKGERGAVGGVIYEVSRIFGAGGSMVQNAMGPFQHFLTERGLSSLGLRSVYGHRETILGHNASVIYHHRVVIAECALQMAKCKAAEKKESAALYRRISAALTNGNVVIALKCVALFSMGVFYPLLRAFEAPETNIASAGILVRSVQESIADRMRRRWGGGWRRRLIYCTVMYNTVCKIMSSTEGGGFE